VKYNKTSICNPKSLALIKLGILTWLNFFTVLFKSSLSFRYIKDDFYWPVRTACLLNSAVVLFSPENLQHWTRHRRPCAYDSSFPRDDKEHLSETYLSKASSRSA